MRFLYPIAIIGVCIATYVGVGWFVGTRTRSRLTELDDIEALPEHEWRGELNRIRRRAVLENAAALRIGATFVVAVALSGLLMIAWLDDTTAQVREADQQNCLAFRALVAILGEDADQEIRVAQSQRNELSDELASAGGDFREIPGYAQLGPGIRRFLNGLIAAEIVEAQEELAQDDAELSQMREGEDAISRFAATLNCPM